MTTPLTGGARCANWQLAEVPPNGIVETFDSWRLGEGRPLGFGNTSRKLLILQEFSVSFEVDGIGGSVSGGVGHSRQIGGP